MKYLIEKENCDLSVFRDHAALIGDQPILHHLISLVEYVDNNMHNGNIKFYSIILGGEIYLSLSA